MSGGGLDLRGISDFLTEGPVVDFRTFVTHRDYLNLHGVYEFWLSKSKDITDNISSVALTGSLAGGKCRCGHERVVTASGYRRFDSLGQGLPYGFTPYSMVVEQPDGTFCSTSHFYKEAASRVLHVHGFSGCVYSGTPAHPILACRRGSSKVELIRCGELRDGDYIVRLRRFYTLSDHLCQDDIQSFLFYGICLSGGFSAGTDAIHLHLRSDVAVWVVGYLLELGITPVVGEDTCFAGMYVSFTLENTPGFPSLSAFDEVCFTSRDHALCVLTGYLLGKGVTVHSRCSLQFSVSQELDQSMRDVLDYLCCDYRVTVVASHLASYTLSEDYSIHWLSALRAVCTAAQAQELCTMFTLREESFAHSSISPLFDEDTMDEDVQGSLGYIFDEVAFVTESVEDVYDITVPATHLFVSGGVVNHNTTMANLLACYYLYRVFSHGDIYKYYGILPGDPIYFLYFSVSLKQAERSGFKQLKSFLRNSPWFKKHAPVDSGIESSIRFGNGLSIDFASGESHAIGLNVVGAILDEANFRKGVGQGLISEYSEVQMLAQQLEDRMYTRFLRGGGHLLSLMIYVSSASYASSFMEAKLQELQGSKTSLVYTAVQYKICPQNYSRRKFEVFCGYDQLSPCIVESAAHKETLLKTIGLPAPQAADLFEKVPEDLRAQFQKNIWLAIQNHCGRSTALRGSFITNYELIRQSYSEELLAASPLRMSSIVVSDQDNIPLSVAFDESRFTDTEKPHVIAVDLSLTGDHASMSCVRYDGKWDVGHHHSHVFTLELIPPAFPGSLKISKVEDLILWLSEKLNIIMVATDNYQSAQMRQRLSEALGLPDVRFSIDASDIPHLTWLSMLVDHRLDMQYSERLDREIREAVHDNKKHKVIKREGSSDDQFQTLVSAASLSDYFCTREGDPSDLQELRLNLSSVYGIERMLRSLGYQSISFDKHHRATFTSGVAAQGASAQDDAQSAHKDSFTASDMQAMLDRGAARARRQCSWLDKL